MIAAIMSHIALNLLAEKRSSTGGDLSAAGGPDNVGGTWGYSLRELRDPQGWWGMCGWESVRPGNVAKAGAQIGSESSYLNKSEWVPVLTRVINFME